MKSKRSQTFFYNVERANVLQHVQGQINGLLVRRVHDLAQERLREAKAEALDLKDDLFKTGPQNFRQNKLVEGHFAGSSILKK